MMPASAKSRHVIGRTALTLGLLLFGLWIASGFVPALIWAVIIAIAVDPLYVRLATKWPEKERNGLAAILMTLAIALLILLPLGLGVAQAAREAYDLGIWLAGAREHGIAVPQWVMQLPIGSQTVATWWQDNLATPDAAAQQLHQLSGSTLLTHSRLIGTGLLHRAVLFFFTMFALFFLLRDRVSIIAQCRRASDRLLGPAGERIGAQAIKSVRGTIDGLILVGLGEGLIMGVAYWALGVPHPLLLGAFTAIAAMIPFGMAVMFVIAALLLMVQANVGGAIAIVVIGSIILFVADHFIRPVLIGSATHLPFIWVLIGILGGVETLGLIGLFIGPATMAILVMLWREFLDMPTPEASTVPE